MSVIWLVSGFRLCSWCTELTLDMKHSDAGQTWSAGAFGAHHRRRTRTAIHLSARRAGPGGSPTAIRRLPAHRLRRVVAVVGSFSVVKVDVRSRQVRERRLLILPAANYLRRLVSFVDAFLFTKINAGGRSSSNFFVRRWWRKSVSRRPRTRLLLPARGRPPHGQS